MKGRERPDRATVVAGLVAFAVATAVARGVLGAGWSGALLVGLVAAVLVLSAFHRLR